MGSQAYLKKAMSCSKSMSVFFFCANGHLYVYHRDEKLYLSMYVYDELMHPNHVPFRHVRNQAKSMSTPKTSLKAQS